MADIVRLEENGVAKYIETHVEAVEGLSGSYAKLPKSEPLWEGALLMKDTQSVKPDKKLSECVNGWVLQLKMYNDGAVANGSIHYGMIMKTHSDVDSGKAVVIPLFLYSGVSAGVKYLYPTDTEIKGYKNNNIAPSSQFVLTAVYEF